MRETMYKVFFVALVCWLSISTVWADTQDTAVFTGTMLPSNEVPPVTAAGTSGLVTVTVRVTRDATGNVNAATVVFDLNYTVGAATTFTGFHIHNAPAGVNGSVVIDTGLSANNSVSVAAGSGRLVRTVNYTTANAAQLASVTGLLATPENYYVNIHSTTNPGGLMRLQLQRNFTFFRPALSPLQENPPLPNLDAEAAALIEVRVNRDPTTGAIVSGVVTFDVDYRFANAVTLTGMHIHQGVVGQNGPIVIDSGINGSSRAISGATRGNVFRIAEIDSSNTSGLQALAGLLADPSQYYINMHTTDNPGGAIRGQLSADTYAFFNQMTGAEETPPINSSAFANSMTIARVTRDASGNITNGVVTFNAAFNMGAATTFTGWHIHNGKFGVAGGVVINTGLSGTNPVVDDDGIGSITRDVTVDGNNGTQLNALRGVIYNPESYYVNLHSTTFPNGIIRAQLVRETYHFKTAMSPANETPPITSDANATGWVTVQISRDGTSGLINGGRVTFDVDHAVNGATTFTGLHIHAGPAGVAGPVVINTGLGGGANSVISGTGVGNITRVVNVLSTDTTQIAMLNTLINNPDQAYINLHTTTNPGGLMRSQMSPFVSNVAQAAGGGDWISSITVRNPSATASVHGIADFYQSVGRAMPDGITDPNISFFIPPSGSVTFNLHNKGTLVAGFARIYSSGAVNVDTTYSNPAFSEPVQTSTGVGSLVDLPIRVGTDLSEDTGIALLNLTDATLLITVRDGLGRVLASSSIPAPAGAHISTFAREVLTPVFGAGGGGMPLPLTGTLTIQSFGSTGPGQIAVTAIQFDGAMTPVLVTALN
jgi:hypothetical protein